MQLKAYNYINNNGYSYVSTGVGSLAGFSSGSVVNSSAVGEIAINLFTKNINNCPNLHFVTVKSNETNNLSQV